MRLLRYLRPTPWDAWVVVSLMLWLIACVTSVLWHVRQRYMDPIDLFLPVLSAAVGVLAGISVVSFSHRVSRRCVWLFAITISVAVLLHVFAAPGLGVRARLDTRRSGADGPTSVVEWGGQLLSQSWFIAACLLGLVVFLQSGMFGAGRSDGKDQRPFFQILRKLSSVPSFLIRHRAAMMITFVTVMVPVVVLRNVFDPDNSSIRYLAPPVIFLSVAFFLTLVSQALPALMAKGRVGGWLFRLVFVGSLLWLAISIQSLFQLQAQQTRTLGARIAPSLCLFMLTLTAHAAFFSASESRVCQPTQGRRRRGLSLWSLVAINVLVGPTWRMLSLYDVGYVAQAYLDDPRAFLEKGWDQNAAYSKTLIRLTEGAARYENPRYGGCLWLSIRDERDADVFRRLKDVGPNRPWPLLIENLQPFVDLCTVGRDLGYLRLVGGEITDDQLSVLAARTSGISMQDVRLPNSSPKGATLRSVSIESKDRVPGLASFLDAYVGPGTKHIHITAPLAPADWDAIVRSDAPWIGVPAVHLPDGFWRSAAIDRVKSLDHIRVFSEKPLDDDWRLMKLVVDKRLHVQHAVCVDRSLAWGLFLVRPEMYDLFPTPDGLPFGEAARRNHWAFGWNEEGDITHLWLPLLNEASEATPFISEVTTLRMDRLGNVDLVGASISGWEILQRFTKLRRLYLRPDERVDDLTFLKSMPDLFHLQIAAASASSLAMGGLDLAKNLETIRLFGPLRASTVKELSRLKKLRRVELVDSVTFGSMTGAEVEQVRGKLPGVTVVHVSDLSQYEPEVSDRFREHQQAIREKLLKRIERELAER